MSGTSVSSEEGTITRFEFIKERANHFKSAADDARSLLRTNFLIIGFFLPIVGSFFTNEMSPERVFNNAYTQVGLVVWLISTILISYTYHRARVVIKSHFSPVESALLGDIPEDERRYRIQDVINEHSGTTGNLNTLITVCTVLTLFATTLFALGVLLSYVSVIPQASALIIVGITISLAGALLITYRYRKKIPSIRGYSSRNKNGWSELTRPRQDLLKKIYVEIGREPFQLSDLPLQSEGPMRSGTITSSSTDESNILLRDISDGKVSEYLLEQMVDEGYFKKTGDSDETTLRSPYSFEDFTINEIEDELEAAFDRLARELEHHTEAREEAADELSLRPDQLLDEFRGGDALERIKRYNRIVERLDNQDLDITARPFEFTDEITYIPTELAEDAYDSIEMEKRTREYDRQRAEEREQARRAENTYRCDVIEPPDEYGELQVYVNDVLGNNSRHERFRIAEAQISDSEREQLEDLEDGDEVQLRIERNVRGDGTYIASVGGP